jgi:Glyoxalase-like domain
MSTCERLGQPFTLSDDGDHGVHRRIRQPGSTVSAAAMRIDHVIYATADLDAAAQRLRTEFGLNSIAGGRHEGLGTHNRIVPLAVGSFIELLAVADRAEASASALGNALLAAIGRGDHLLGWAAAVTSIGEVATRLDIPITVVGRQGRTARLAGLAEAIAEPTLPFFIERPRRPTGTVAGTLPAIAWIEVAGDAGRLEHWIGAAALPVRVVSGEPSVRAVGIGEQVVRTAGAD